MGRKKKPDQLALDCIAAAKAGMSYGKWKAMQPPKRAEVEDIPWVPPKEGGCLVCGEPLEPPQRKFCSITCNKNYNYRLQRPNIPRKKAYEDG